MKAYAQLPLTNDRSCFRLLQIFDGANDDPLVAAMMSFELTDNVNYEALSHCWGNGDKSKAIEVNNEDIAITAELHAALLRIRADTKQSITPLRVWVDAICINQQDDLEKSHQVILMRDIFAGASMVRAWLGVDNEFTRIAFDILERFSQDDGTADGSKTRDTMTWEPILGSSAMAWFLALPYFERMWILQELVVARAAYLQCGSYRLDFERLQTGLRRMTGSKYFPFSPVVASISYIGHWQDDYRVRTDTEFSTYRALWLIIDSRNRKATDPRDKLYSLRGIVNSELAKAIEVDYSKSPAEVYTRFTNTMLSKLGDLQLFSAVELGHRSNATIKLPSYVPDYSQQRNGSGFFQRFYRFKPECFFRASGTMKATVKVTESGVRVKGFEVDRVQQVLDVRPLLRKAESTTEAERIGPCCNVDSKIVQILTDELLPYGKYAQTYESPWLATFRTLTADRSALSPRVSDAYKAAFFSAFSSQGVSDCDEKSARELPDKAWEEISGILWSIICDKVMFVTAKGYIGLGYDGIRENDMACLFYGGEALYLIRSNGNDTHEFFGEAYLHGLMDGEALHDMQDAQEQYFELV